MAEIEPRLTVSEALSLLAKSEAGSLISREKTRKWGLDDAAFLAAELFAGWMTLEGDVHLVASRAVDAARVFHDVVSGAFSEG